MNKTKKTEKDFVEGDVAYLSGIVMEEELPKKFVFYPKFYGSFFAFSDKRDEIPIFCECSKKGIENYFELNFPEDKTKKHLVLPCSQIEKLDLPASVVQYLFSDAADKKADIMDVLNFEKDLCHVCNKKIPKLQYCHKMYGGKFVRMYGWYINQLRWEMGLPRRRIFKEINLEDYPTDLKEILSILPKEIPVGYWQARSNPSKYDMEEVLEEQSSYQKNHRKLSNYFENIIRLRLGYKKVGESWVTETSLYYMIKNMYPDFTVINHHRPPELKGLELDIFVEEKVLGIEYQGIQHFKPVKHWGGEESFKKVQERDKKKKRLCEKNNIKLVYFNYDEEITEGLIKDRIADLLGFSSPKVKKKLSSGKDIFEKKEKLQPLKKEGKSKITQKKNTSYIWIIVILVILSLCFISSLCS